MFAKKAGHYFVLILSVFFAFSGALEANVTRSAASARMREPEDCVGLLRRADRSRIRLGHWNFENFFDPFNNRNKDDEEFLPYAIRPPKVVTGRGKPSIDWNRERMAVKLENAQRMVRAMGKPPIFSGVEVESQFVAQALAKALGYQGFFITNSVDGRGVNVATFFDEYEGLEVIGHGEIPLLGEAFSTHPTRSILEVEFLINGRHRLFFHENHWPSQMGPPASRHAAAWELWKRVSQLAAKYPDAEFVSSGDFNVIDGPSESPHAIRFLEEERKENPYFVDLERYLRQQTTLPIGFPKGTYFYDKKEVWNSLDRFLLSSRLVHSRRRTGLKADLKSYEIVAPSWATAKYTLKDGKTVERIPRAYDHSADTPAAAGYSDHFPIVFDLIDLDEMKR